MRLNVFACNVNTLSAPVPSTQKFVRDGEFGRAHVLFYEDQEVSPEFAHQVKAQLLV